MRRTLAVTLVFLVLTLHAFAQDDPPTFKAKATSAFVWEEDGPSGATSSIVRDPLTETVIHRLSHGGIEVSSRAGFERIETGEVGEVVTFTTTIVNNTESELSVRPGGASFDGHLAWPLSIVVSKKGLSEKERKNSRELARMHCFAVGSYSIQYFFSPNSSSNAFIVNAKRALTVSFVTKDPRNYSILCSPEGCYPKGSIRFSVTVNATDFVFIWPGRDVVDCGS